MIIRMPLVSLSLALLLIDPAAVHAETIEGTPKPRPKPAVAAPVVASDQLVTIIPRKDWQAKPPLFKMKAHVPLSILVHHTAGPVNARRDIFYKMRSLQAYSQKSATLGNGRKRAAWADVPYHFYISADGAVAEGRDVKFSGDTNTNYDPTGHIQVVLEGNFEKTRPTPDQWAALEALVAGLAKKWKVPAAEIRPHKQVAATLCPGRNFMAGFPDLRERLAARVK